MAITVDVVLTAFKKMDVLMMQLEAVKSQTYPINRLFLFKDGINSYYEINLKHDILDLFDDVYISEENVGVWGRFEYALKKSTADCICIFDDDTVPGKKWIENCVNEFSKQPGIYGTNGVMVLDAMDYPYRMLNVGWHMPNKKRKLVDFVGHAWFLRPEWIGWMLELRKEYTYKYVAEDMALSFACKKRGINTFVPPHPYEDVQLWGSIPKYGSVYGIQSSAVSASSVNMDMMNEALIRMYNDGWNFLYRTNPEYLYEDFETEEDLERVIFKDILDFSKAHSELYIYGAGSHGTAMYFYLQKRGIEIAGFVVSQDGNTKKNFNRTVVPVMSVKELNRKKDCAVILGLDKRYHSKVRGMLGRQISTFLLDDKSYCYDDIIRVITNEN